MIQLPFYYCFEIAYRMWVWVRLDIGYIALHFFQGRNYQLPEEQENNLNSHFNPEIYLSVWLLLFGLF